MTAYNLQSVSTHLSNAPGSFLSVLRSKFTKKKGLVQNSKILGELREAILSEERVKNYLAACEEWQLLILRLIYASRNRGLTLNELWSNFEAEQKTLQEFLNASVGEMLIWKAQNKSAETIYFGFSDFYYLFDELAFTIGKVQSYQQNAGFLSNGQLAEWHLVSLLSMSQLGKISIKKDGTFTHWTNKFLGNLFSRYKTLDGTLAEDEKKMLFSFLIDEKFLLKNLENGTLKPSCAAFDFIKSNGFRLYSELLFWWELERFKHKDDLKYLLKFFEKPVSARVASQLFWPFDSRSRLMKNETSISWQMLPRPLRELYLLGILKVSMNKKKVLSFAISKLGEAAFFAKHSNKLEIPICSCSSNFEWLMSISNGAMKMFQISCFAQVKNDEEPLRFVMGKDTFLEGLRSRMPKGCVEDFILWNESMPSVASALKDWNDTYNCSSIENVKLLCVRDLSKHRELSNYKPFLECIDEVIPDFGFLLKPESEKRAREILSHFSLDPAPSTIEIPTEIFSSSPEVENFKTPFPNSENAAQF